MTQIAVPESTLRDMAGRQRGRSA